MNRSMARILFAGAFAIIALLGALTIELCSGDVPEWLVAIIAAAVGYMFGHVQENGLGNKRRS